MSDRESKGALFEAIALMGKAFASPVRLELLDLLAQAPRSVEELARARAVDREHVAASAGAARGRHGHTRTRGHTGALRARRRRGAAAVAGSARRVRSSPG